MAEVLISNRVTFELNWKEPNIVTNDVEKREIFKDLFLDALVSVEQAGVLLLVLKSPRVSLPLDLCYGWQKQESKIKALPPKCSISSNGIPQIVYRKFESAVGELLRLTYCHSYEDGSILKYFRLFLVTPVSKIILNQIKDFQYRLVTQGCIVCIFEKIMADDIAQYLTQKQAI